MSQCLKSLSLYICVYLRTFHILCVCFYVRAHLQECLSDRYFIRIWTASVAVSGCLLILFAC